MAKLPCTIVVPVFGLCFRSRPKTEVKIGRVTFLSPNRLTRTRKRFGLYHTLSEYKAKLTSALPLWDEADAVAVLRTRRDPSNKDNTDDFRIVSESFLVLASAIHGYSGRGKHPIALRRRAVGEPVTISIFGNTDSTLRVNSSHIDPVHGPIDLSKRWHEHAKHSHLYALSKMCDAKLAAPNWRLALWVASQLRGQSFLATTLAGAFLANMIAIERLIVSQNDKTELTIIDRLLAIFGWISGENPDSWRDMVHRLYQRRCSYVHEGDHEWITPTDVIDSDEILANLLSNFCRHPNWIGCKNDLIRISEEHKARMLLGLPAKRPTTLAWSHRVGRSPEQDAVAIGLSNWSVY